MPKILIIEDDAAQLQILEQGLAHFQYQIETRSDGIDGLELLQHVDFDLAIVDWELPRLSGLEVCQKYRDGGGMTPILFLTGKKTMVSNKVNAFDFGADDYLLKPFAFAELISRVKALLKRSPNLQRQELVFENMIVDSRNRQIHVDGEAVHFTPGELDLIELLMRNPKKFFLPTELLAKIFKTETDVTAVRQRVKFLKQKFDKYGIRFPIVSKKGFGYSWDD